MACQHKVVPYVVELDASQQIVRHYPAEPILEPTDPYIRSALSQWIRYWRVLTPDISLIESRTAYVYSMLTKTSSAEVQLTRWYREYDPYVRAADETVAVDIEGVLKLSESTWQVEWIERVSSRGGSLLSSQRYAAAITIEFGKPNENTLLLNPTGLYIHHVDWQEAIVRDD